MLSPQSVPAAAVLPALPPHWVPVEKSFPALAVLTPQG